MFLSLYDINIIPLNICNVYYWEGCNGMSRWGRVKLINQFLYRLALQTRNYPTLSHTPHANTGPHDEVPVPVPSLYLFSQACLYNS